MALQTTNYKCPSCTGPLHYVGDSNRLECDYCGSTFSVQEIEGLYVSQNTAAAQAFQEDTMHAQEYEENYGWGEDAEHMRAYSCPSCGAEIMCDDTTAATSCPYCGNPTIVPGQFSGSLKPDYVIPFKLSKEDAINGLKNYYKGKKLLPNEFANNNHIEEIKGIYVPFWLYDGKAVADIQFDATKVQSYTRGDYRITITDHFYVRRAGSVNFEMIPADGSSQMPDAHMDAIEPFDYSELKPFSMSYLPGFLADRYDVTAQECSNRAILRATNTVEDIMKGDVVGYSTCVPVSKSSDVKGLGVRYALMPVWLLSTKWNGNNYLFSMNGQTGKFIGDLPISKMKVFKWLAGITLPGAAVMFLIMMFLGI